MKKKMTKNKLSALRAFDSADDERSASNVVFHLFSYYVPLHALSVFNPDHGFQL
jgi:hypothetical protein